MIGEKRARMGLCALTMLGSAGLSRTVQQFGAEEVWVGLLERREDSPLARRARDIDLDALHDATAACGAVFITPEDAQWPASLNQLEGVEIGGQGGVPYGLWVRGAPLDELTSSVAIVGSRACSSYGENTAATFAADLASTGRSVISGLAFGIDAAAHRGALAADGSTVAVLACGLDRTYPAAHGHLAELMVRQGALISETPPGYRPTRYAFLARNRIIAALAEGVVLVEAALRSGAKNTASWALGLGKPVLAVPGPITSSLSATPHRMIRDQEAILVTSSRDVEEALAPLGTIPEQSSWGDRRAIDSLPDQLRLVVEAMPGKKPVSAAELAALTGGSLLQTLAAVGELEAGGWCERTSTGEFRLARTNQRG